LVINWLVPAAAPFYTATRSDTQGITLRRRFRLDQLRLLGIVDENLGAPSTPAASETQDLPASGGDIAPGVDEQPAQPEVVDAILAQMDRARGTSMRDIVATIEARQYELITDSIDGLLVIQGGPGTGKTAIALHRAAWLAYNHRSELGRSGILVVGPNRAFMEYVARVLPSLGESSVVQTTIDRLPDTSEVRVRAAETAGLARLKGDLRMADAVRNAVKARVRPPGNDVEVRVDRLRVTIPAPEIATLIEGAWEGADSYLAARERFRRSLVSAVSERIPESRGLFRSGPSASEIEVAVTGSGGAADRMWPTVTGPEVVRDLLGSRQRLTASASFFTDEERAALYRERARSIREESWTAGDMPLLDEADVAIRGVRGKYGYVLVDETQDLTPMQLQMVLRRSSGRATLVGDIAQSTGPWRFQDWQELVDASGNEGPVRIAELAVGYRVPRQIIDLASTLIPRIAPDLLVPTAVREGAEEPRLVQVAEDSLLPAFVAEAQTHLEGGRTVGLIAPLERLDEARTAFAEAGLLVGDVLADGLTRPLTLLSPAQAKGLEFDRAVVLDPAGMAGENEDWEYAYVALTRATQTLSVVYYTEQPLERPALEPPPGDVVVAVSDQVPSVVPTTPDPVLGPRYTEALMQAKFLHLRQVRRGTNVPYLAHLQAVASLVLEDGGGEDEAIAALLHDSVEDNGPAVLDGIADQFGADVARIVAGCTDPNGQEGMSWRDLKAEHLRDLGLAGPQVRRVALAEKLENARALLRDYRRFGDRLWERMSVDSDDLLWYVVELADLFTTERPGDMAFELKDVVERLLDLASSPSEELSGSPGT